MPNLSLEELREVAQNMITAEMVGDDDAVMAALEPITNMIDTYRLTAALVQVAADSLPNTECPVHGAACTEEPIISFAVLPVINGEVDTAALAGGHPGLPPGMEAAYPGQVAYMRMLVAVLTGDEAQLAAVFAAAVHNGHGPYLLHLALGEAADALRAGKARQQ